MAGALFVCARNVCRSPLMASSFRTAAAMDGWEVLVASAGTAARPGEHMCETSSLLLPPTAPPPGDYRSRSLDDVDLEAFDLVLTADRSVRSGSARVNPGARARTFTVREALMLAAATGIEGERESVADAASPLAAAATLLHGRRGRTSAMPARVGLFRRRGNEGAALDIPDVHGRPPRVHREGLLAARDAAGSLPAALRALVAGVAP